MVVRLFFLQHRNAIEGTNTRYCDIKKKRRRTKKNQRNK